MYVGKLLAESQALDCISKLTEGRSCMSVMKCVKLSAVSQALENTRELTWWRNSINNMLKHLAGSQTLKSFRQLTREKPHEYNEYGKVFSHKAHLTSP